MTDYVKKLNEIYPPGTRLELLHMDDPYAPVPVGTRGTVNYVSDYGGIDMKWANGRTLSLMPDKDKFRPLTMDEIAEEEISKGHSVVSRGDDCQIVLPDEPVDCSSLGYFDELEEECWDLVKSYCSRLGIKMIPDEDGKPPISFDIAKGIQDQILGELHNAGVRFNFDEISEDMDNTPVMRM